MVNQQNSTLIPSCALGFQTETILVVFCCQHRKSMRMLVLAKLAVLMLMSGRQKHDSAARVASRLLFCISANVD